MAFGKSGYITKRITGVARLKGAPVVNARPGRSITRAATITGAEGGRTAARLLLEVASTDEDRRRGLMGRDEDSLPRVCGMLFEGLSGGGCFWMRGCLMPIDILFMDRSGVVTRTYEMEPDADESDPERYPYGPEDVSAIEVRGGLLAAKGIRPGCRVSVHRITNVEKGKRDG